MSDYSFKTWETMNVGDIYFPGTDMYFIILDHPLASTYKDPSQDPDILYSGVHPGQYDYNNLENILSTRIELMSMPGTYYPVAFEEPRRKTFYLYETYDDWEEYITAEDWTENQCITIDVEYDWTYIPDLAYMSELSDPIEYKIDPRQYITWTSQQVVPGTPNRMTVQVEGSSEDPWWITILHPEDQCTLHLQAGDLAGYTPGTIVIINNLIRLELVEQCADYCLYYQNRLGAWNWLLVKGKSLQKDKVNRLYYKKRYQAQNQSDYNKVNYTSNISENWELSTSWLTDEQSAKMPDLLEANQVMLQDLKNNLMIPVIVSNSSVEYKTYKNQGRKLYAYTIEVEASKPKFRI